MSQDREDEPIFKIDTVPPPAGESDAYNAPTRVGPLLSEQWDELMKGDVEDGAVPEKERSTSPPSAGATASADRERNLEALAAQPLPELSDHRADEEDDDDITMIHRKARPSMRDADLADPMFGLPEGARAAIADIEDLEGGGPFSASLLGAPAPKAWQPREIAMAAAALVAVAVIGGVIALVAFGH